MGIKIVIVDDDRTTLAIIEKTLIMQGFWVYSARDGEEGFELIKKERPTLVISDMLMPKLHGVDLCKKIKVILMTAVYKSNLPLKHEAKECGAEDIINKPLDMGLMIKKIYEVLDISKDDLESK